VRSIVRLRRELPLVCLLASLLAALLPSSALAAGPTAAWPLGTLRPLVPLASAPMPTDAERVVELVNAERALAGLAPLARSAKLAAEASDYAAAMADGGVFSHIALDGSGIQQRGLAHGYLGWTFLGENLAAGQDTPERVVAAWMASPTHRANILAPQACDIGVGRATSTTTRYDNYWVMEVGCGLLSAG
jgi:uncharacterized protein YkwD